MTLLVQKSASGSNAAANRHSGGGLHITPSPSDSGIVDYEVSATERRPRYQAPSQTLIRDKEVELNTVRQAMEQNEEVLIRVYQVIVVWPSGTL